MTRVHKKCTPPPHQTKNRGEQYLYICDGVLALLGLLYDQRTPLLSQVLADAVTHGTKAVCHAEEQLVHARQVWGVKQTHVSI